MTDIIDRMSNAIADELAMIYGRRVSSENARRIARRAIEAVGKPTKAMAETFYEAGGEFHFDQGWEALIEDALK